MNAILMQTLTLFLILMLGFVAAKAGWLTKDMRPGLSGLLLNVTTPCVILRAFQYPRSMEVWHGMLIAAAFITFFILAGLLVCGVIFRAESRARRTVLAFGTAFGNVGFMGIPVIGAYVGAQGLIYVSVGIAIFNILAWTIGVRAFDPGQFRIRKIVTFPPLYAVAAGLIMFAFEIPLPSLLDKVTEMVSGINSPLSMMLVGAILAESSLGAFAKDRCALLAVLLRLAVIPAGALGLCALFHIEGTTRTVLVLLNGMPMAVNTVLFALMFHGDEELSSCLVALSTLLYLPAVFCWMLIL